MRPAVFDERELRGRAAHVEGDQIAMAGQLAVDCRHQRAGRRARFDHPHGVALHRGGGRDAAGRLHHEQPPAIPALAQRRLQSVQVRAHRRHDVPVHDGRRRALVLTERRRDFVGERHRDVRRFLGRQLSQAPLVRGIEIRVEQADRERRDPARDQRADRAPRIVFVERIAHRAVGEHALRHLPDQPARDERRRLLDLEVVHLIALLAPDDQHVAEAARREETDAFGLALDDDVRAERGAVHRVDEVAPRHAGARDQLVEPGQTGLRRIGIRREPLRGVELTRGRLQDEVGERAAHVEADAIAHGDVNRGGGAIMKAIPAGRPATGSRDRDTAGPSDT